MKIEETILYVLAERNGGLRTEQIADIINRRKLHVRKDDLPVTSAQVYAVDMRHPDTFVKLYTFLDVCCIEGEFVDIV